MYYFCNIKDQYISTLTCFNQLNISSEVAFLSHLSPLEEKFMSFWFCNALDSNDFANFILTTTFKAIVYRYINENDCTSEFYTN